LGYTQPHVPVHIVLGKIIWLATRLAGSSANICHSTVDGRFKGVIIRIYIDNTLFLPSFKPRFEGFLI